jgi:tetratricopeptide (TPR) repeat protein
MSTPEKIITMNLQGIEQLQQGAFTGAVESFRRAIHMLNEVGTPPRQIPHIEIAFGTATPVIPVPFDFITEEHECAFSPNNMFTLYKHALYFSFDYFLTQQESNIQIALLYNLGLACHSLGMTEVDKSSFYLRKALKCYKYALSLFASLNKTNFDGHFIVPSLALLTNMGHLYSHAYRSFEANSCRDDLRMLLESQASLSLPAVEEDFFFGALAYSMTHKDNIAPAA